MRRFAFTLTLLTLVGCATSGDRDSGGNGDSGERADNRGRKEMNEGEEDDFYASGNLKTFTVSLSNNGQTSKAIDRREAASIANKLGTKERKDIVAKMSAERLSGKGFNDVINITQKLMALELQKSSKRKIPDFAKMELVLAAIQSKKYSFAEYFLYDLFQSKDKNVQAMAHTAEGIIAAEDGRLPEAVLSWEEALKRNPNYEAARLNLGVTAAKYGDFERAKKLLGGMQSDWYAAHALIVAERLTKGVSKASSLCDRLLEEKPKFKPGIWNCALNEAQGNRDFAKATALINKTAQFPGYPKIDAAAQELRKVIEAEKRKAKPAKADGASRSGQSKE